MNFEDDLSKDIEAALSQTPKSPASTPAGDAAPPPAPPDGPSPGSDAPASGGERARDENGKFVAKAPEEKKPATKSVTSPEGAASQQPASVSAPAALASDVATARTENVVPPPANWKGAGKIAWNDLPANVQKEIADDYSRVSGVESELNQYKAAIGDRAQVLAATYGSVGQGLQNLFAISDMATKNPTGFVLWFAQQRGIDLTQLGQGSGQSGQAPQAPDSNPLMQELTSLRSQFAGLQQHLQQAQNAPIMAEVERFKSDPAHPYYNDVEPHIIALLQQKAVSGNSPSERLKNAYDAAVWARPDIRQRLLDDERKKFTENAAAKVTQAKQAAGSITGSPAGAKASTDEPDEDLDATIKRHVNRLVPA